MTATSTRPDISASAESEPGRTRFQNAARTVLDRWTQADRPGDVLLRLARDADLSALRSLNARAIAELGRNGLFMPMSPVFLAEMVRDGIILVLERDGEPLGYSIAVPAGRDRHPFIPGADTDRIGLLFGTACDPALRGQGWHSRLIVIRQRIFAAAGFVSAQSTVSPFNRVSLANLMKSGFHVVGLKTLLDGYPRFLLRHDLRWPAEPSGEPRGIVLPEAGDLSEHEDLLADGFIATGIRKGAPCVLLYTEGRGQRSGRPDP